MKRDFLGGHGSGERDVISTFRTFEELKQTTSCSKVARIFAMIVDFWIAAPREDLEKPLRVYVYSYDFECVPAFSAFYSSLILLIITLREVVLVPHRRWGGERLLGCVIRRVFIIILFLRISQSVPHVSYAKPLCRLFVP